MEKHKKHRHHLFLYIVTLFFSILWLFLLSVSFGQDLMEQAFQTAKSYDAVLDLWETKDAVGNEILRESASVDMNENFGQGCFVNGNFVDVTENECLELGGDRDTQVFEVNANPPLIVRITKFLLRMTIVLSITMVIYNSILYMVQVLWGKDWKSAEAKNDLIRVVGGIIVALMSVGLINLVVSIPKSSLTTSEDLWYINQSSTKQITLKHKNLNDVKKIWKNI